MASRANGAAPALKRKKVEEEAHHISNGDVKVNNWEQPGPAAFDFRSDVVTTPTSRMLSAIASTSLLDDVFQQDPTTLGLEKFVAELTGKEAALLVLSGTMGNQVAIRAHLQGPPHSVVSDYRSHIVQHEAGGVSSLCQAMVLPVDPSNGTYLTLEDVKGKAQLGSDVHTCPTKLISLENTLAGVVMPLEECQRISVWARENGIGMHLDGARLWEAAAAGGETLEEQVTMLKEYCKCFDTISLCFSKGLGAPIGSIVVFSSPELRERARHVRKSIGGGLRQAGVVSAAARVSVEDTFLGGKLRVCHERAKRVRDMWESMGGKVVNPVETNMAWIDIEAAGISKTDFIALGQKAGLRFMGGRLVCHYQIGDEALQRLSSVFESVLKGKTLEANGGAENMPPEKLVEGARVAR